MSYVINGRNCNWSRVGSLVVASCSRAHCLHRQTCVYYGRAKNPTMTPNASVRGLTAEAAAGPDCDRGRHWGSGRIWGIVECDTFMTDPKVKRRCPSCKMVLPASYFDRAPVVPGELSKECQGCKGCRESP